MATINQIEVNGTTYDINATELSSPATIDGISFDGSESVTRYAACATAAATAAKTAEIGADFTLEPGARVIVKFTYGNTAIAPTLDINETGAKAIMTNGTTAAGSGAWADGEAVEFVYDGTRWEMVSGAQASTSVSGRVMLDATLSISGAAADAAVVGSELTDLKSALSEDVAVDLSDTTLMQFFINMSTGKFASTSTAVRTLAVPAKGVKAFSVACSVSSTKRVGFADSLTSGATVYDATEYTGSLNATAVNENDNEYLVIQLFISTDSEQTVSTYLAAMSISTLTAVDSVARAGVNSIPQTIDNQLFEVGVNKYDPSAAVAGYLKNATGAIASGSYVTTDFIDVSGFTNGCYVNRQMRKILFYDSSKSPIAASYQTNATSAGVLTLDPSYKYVRFSFADTLTNIIVCDSSTPVSYIPYCLIAKTGKNYFNSDTETAALAAIDGRYTPDILHGKKWAVCGDSFTAGADSGTLSDGIYAGHKIVYPYIIGNRVGMTIYNFFNNGRTLAMPETPGDFVNSLTCPGQDYYYQNIPADTDYITVYLGINDNHHAPGSGGGDGEDNTGEIPIGTIDDNTTATYYGAWNVVLTWLIANRPFAHIGMIVTNGTTAAYRTAQLDIAKKYGIPYIDMNGNERTPCMIRSCNSDIASAVRTAITEKQRISSSNTHPNNAAHQYEATFIEQFLRTL